jgi:hypothetical protein
VNLSYAQVRKKTLIKIKFRQFFFVVIPSKIKKKRERKLLHNLIMLCILFFAVDVNCVYNCKKKLCLLKNKSVVSTFKLCNTNLYYAKLEKQVRGKTTLENNKTLPCHVEIRSVCCVEEQMPLSGIL